MFFLSKFQTKQSALEGYVREIESNMENNYKDAAQEAFRELTETFRTLVREEKLNENQKAHYGSIISGYEMKLKGYTHKDQQPYWTHK